MNRKRQILKYLLSDFISALAAWWLFFLFRKDFIESAKHGYSIQVGDDANLMLGLLLLPSCWLLFYALSGYYQDILRRSRIREFWRTLVSTTIGGLAVFFVLILDDSVADYRDYYRSLMVFWSLHFVFTVSGRLLIAGALIRKIQKRRLGFPTLLVGSGPAAARLFRELDEAPRSEGFQFVGYVRLGSEPVATFHRPLPELGLAERLPEFINQLGIEEVIIAVEEEEHQDVPALVNMLQNEFVRLKILPDAFSMVVGLVKMNNILGAILLEVDFEVMPPWQKSAKRIFDILFSLLALILALPFMLVVAAAIRLSSPGPVFYTQERIGYKGKPFNIIKFRTMKQDAELSGPKLSSKTDPRITSIGRLLRKTRLDELPQFFNVLKGEMSVVGPRPERQHFIDQILVKAPYYRRLHRVKPGITSWGQVKFGYAENVDEMVERLRYDILYLENMSIGLDVRIMLYTILIMVQGRGK
ncbi:MAG: sugar transferase [Bacteroidetes bacterium]|nr:sugar transferase [Bacteroidota bacterium]